MELVVQIIFVSFLGIGTLIALGKDFKKSTDEQPKQPIMLIFDSLSTIGLMLFIISIVILENLLLGDIAIIIFIIGIVYDVIRYGKSTSVFKKVRAVGLGLLIVVFYVFFYH